MIARVAEEVRRRVTGSHASAVERFARRYYADLAADDLLGKTADDLYGAMLAHWRLAERRQPGTPLIRVYNPDYEQHGWQSPHTVVEIVTDDMPFLVDSVSQELNRHGLTIHLIIHPLLRVRRDRQGELVEVLPCNGHRDEGDGILTEAVMHFEVDQETDPAALIGLRDDLAKVLADVRAVVEDWPKIRARLREVMDVLKTQPLPFPEDEVAETLDLLRWIERRHFTFIGFRAFDLAAENGELLLRPAPESGLGVFRDADPGSPIRIPPNLRDAALEQSLLIITKSTARSPVHRPAHLDHVGIKRFDEQGRVIGEWRFQGLYTSQAYSSRPSEIPVLRRKVAKVLERAPFAPDSHAGKTLRNVLDNLPRGEMFQATDEELYTIATGILNLQERTRLKLFIRRDLYGRFVSALIYVPRDRYTTTLRLRFQNILMKAFDGQSSEFNVRFSESVLARVHFIIQTPLSYTADYDHAELETRLAEAMQSWEDRLRANLHGEFSEARAKKIFSRYRNAFPPAYRDDFPAPTALLDIRRLEDLSENRPLVTTLYRPPGGPDELLRFKVFGSREPLALSDVLPILERMGLRVLEARPYEIEPRERESCWILDFDMTTAQDIEVELLEVKAIFQEAFGRIVRGEAENDGFNRLVLAAELAWREIVMLRALCKYLMQTRLPFSQAYMEQSLASNAPVARMLVELFKARFDPAGQEIAPAPPFVKGGQESETSEESSPPFRKGGPGGISTPEPIKEQIEHALEAVASLDEDRILRRFLAVILAITRTNYFQDQSGKDYLAFKLDSRQVPDLPLPLPMFEIFVYAPWVEGAHLRGGRVARGGIRWSDRREDFRTEILGLMKAQMVKNAVIVPVGAKGGFVCKRLPAAGDRDAVNREVIRCYRTFIGGLLDLTDNLADGEVQPPSDMIRHDGDDPYLVVAADKGTAAFSDIANEIAGEYAFWLGDAFASGGRHGYDHKKMGITARGAWESVKRHFREQGADTQTVTFTVTGIGDMSGDVFGNGMLQSPQIRLIAAFDHRHIFIDPDPDPARSYAERQRLFNLPRSAWSDYDPKAIARGGGVYARSSKSIALSPEARAALGVEAEKLMPNELIQACLRAPVDLLWNGGIGTYVKATGERHADVGDRANDAVRIDATELRCKVIGEGGNLGLTQLARIEYARHGGRINTDAIDNSGGVDCSDHEVNIKILLNPIVAGGDLTFKQRNELLARMTGEVADLVLRDNYLQTQAISIAAAQTPELVSDHARLITKLEKGGDLKRRLEALPGDAELAERESNRTGLTRPELAVLLAYSKIRLFGELEDSDIADDPYLCGELWDYFPERLRARFAAGMQTHPLRREIVAAVLTNGLINRMGSTFCLRLQEHTGADAADIVRAYTAACEIFGARGLWEDIEALDNRIAAAVQSDMMIATVRLLEQATLWLLRHRRPPLDIPVMIGHFSGAVKALFARLPRLLREDASKNIKTEIRRLRAAGAPVALARRVASLDPLFAALNIATVAKRVDLDIARVVDAYFELGAALELDWLQDRLDALPGIDHWHRSARAMMHEELNNELRELTADLLRVTSGIQCTGECIEAWLEHNRSGVAHYRSLIADLKTAAKPDLAMLAVAVRAVRSLARDENRLG